MRYLSVCSGIEAATVAWHTLGWTPVAFSEIEPFPAAVLAHHYPNVPNYGDMTKHKEWPLGPGSIDLLVGGTPCQSFSVAGLRKGISDPRGGLMLTYLEIAQRLRPRWIVWENVPGVLSSGGGRDFGSFLGALGELRYGWAYRVIDAQYCRVDGRWPKAVPQRRRRVFVVGCDLERDPRGRERAAEVLALGTGLRWHLAESGKTRKAAPADAEAGVGAGCWWDGGGCAGTLTKQNAGGAQRMPDKDNFGAVLQPVGYRWQNDRYGLIEDGTAPACRASAGSSGFHEMNHPVVVQQPVPFTKSKRAQSVTDDETWVDGKVNPTLSLFDQGDTRATTVAVIATVDMQACKGNANVGDGSVSPTLCKPSGNDVHAVMVGTDLYNGAITGDVAATMGTPGSSVNASGPTVMAFAQNQVGEIRTSNVSGTINTNSNASGRNTPMAAVAHAFYSTGGTHGVNQHPEVSPAVKVGSGLGIPSPPAVACPTLTANNDPSRSPQSSEVTQQVAAVHAASMTVRRLTNRECERLQGFPDDYTLIPWRKKPATECPDGPRYKALGNSMAVNCMAWIGERIAAVEARND